MVSADTTLDPSWAALAAARLASATRPESLAALARELDVLLPAGPERILAALTPGCPRAPMKVHGVMRATGAEVARLAEAVGDDGVRLGRGRLAGAERHVLTVVVPASAAWMVGVERAEHGGAEAGVDEAARVASVFAIEVDADASPDAGTVAIVAGLCAVLAALYSGRADEVAPAALTENLAAQQERARTIAELGEAHEAALTTILAALRSRALGDAPARAAATEAASAALLELRAAGDRDRALSEVPAGAAFARIAEELRAVCRHSGTALELVAPDDPRLLPGELAGGARAVTRGVVLVLLDHDGGSRLRVSWAVSPDALTIVVRDDGAGDLAADALAAHRTAERVAALGGELRLDAAAGWGTTVTVTLPLAPLVAADPSPLALLNAREREVLSEVAKGRRNREIAAALSVTDHTVKFHVANILRKLGVATRGEAAAVAREQRGPA